MPVHHAGHFRWSDFVEKLCDLFRDMELDQIRIGGDESLVEASAFDFGYDLLDGAEAMIRSSVK